MTAAAPKPKRVRKAPKGSQWGKIASERTKHPKVREGEPKTMEGRARKKLQFGLLYRSGCVFTYAEMMEVLKVVPQEWMERPCS